ncbi:MAG: thioredoxin domain-containing protein [Deltaproteobacteria bacterium]|nr:thioredoxin domain-containing protein [Deltaproteobacteria bacterium]
MPGAPPGAVLFESIHDDLVAAWEAKGPGYQPRTRHFAAAETPKYVNRLIRETSPYLLQHAHNPVNWYPWGDEAFSDAKALGRPVLLSVGYSTCHWCHVMEHESFEDEHIARFINEHYIPVKVDREERPDVDAIYMQAVQMMTGHGGWPMTVWLTPDRRPYYGGTYYPPYDGDRGQPIGFLSLLGRLEHVFKNQPSHVEDSAKRVAEAIRSQSIQAGGGDLPGPKVLHAAFMFCHDNVDRREGGMLGAPKFPSSLPIRLLFRYHRRTGENAALDMARLTLRKMANGGMHDHVAGGFHRYSTDEEWLVPHFEKMLYDNALLAVAYAEGWQVTKDDEFARVARDILDYVARDMTSPEGAFYSATDADSIGPDGHMEEGYYFTWTPDELREALGADAVRLVEAYFNVTPYGNFEGRNILHVTRPLDEIARTLSLSMDKARTMLAEARAVLYAKRNERPAPLRDDKILTSWNGLMISAFARVGFAFNEAAYIERAERAATFVLSHLAEDGRLLHSFKDGRARHRGYLDDYAFFIAALLDLFEATGDVRPLREAKRLTGELDRLYGDGEGGAYFMTASDHEQLLVRQKPYYDGAEPSGNSVAVLNLLRLNALTGDDAYRARADKAMAAFGDVMDRMPMAMSEMLLALDFRHDRVWEIVIADSQDGGGNARMLDALRGSFQPNCVLARAGREADAPIAEGKTAVSGMCTAYVCEQGICRQPVTSPEKFLAQISEVRSLRDA